MEFVPFPKIGRLSREIIITEKIDGTNACVCVYPLDASADDVAATVDGQSYGIMAGSRTRWITPQQDNFGFAAWVQANAEDLVKLGEGRHYGEWWGSGIQRGYDQKVKRFSLFNVRRWSDPEKRPKCCDVVPTLYTGDFDTNLIEAVMDRLLSNGSAAAAGFMRPEGVVIFHSQSGALFKKTFEKDDAGKGKEPLMEIAA
jgi:hypothetical protein